MKAIAVRPGTPNSVHIRDVAKPKVADIPNGRGVLVRMLQCGVDATDREINEALYGNAPPGDDYLMIGHESFGIVEEIGPAVKDIRVGDYVTATVRRPGKTIYDLIGTNDMTGDEVYYERGINLRHGFMTEYYVEDQEYVIRVPKGLKHLGVLMEPMSIVAKAIQQAYEAQRRLRVWRPRLAYVMGAGQIGLLSTLSLRIRGIEVYTIARTEPPSRNSEIVAGYEGNYISTRQTPMAELVKKTGKPDLIIDATGSSAIAFDSMQHLNLNGALVLTSVTGGKAMHSIPSDKINLEWVLGNKLMLGTVNANRDHFELGIRDLCTGELMFPGITQKILTNPVQGLENFQEMMRLLVEEKSALKVYVDIAKA